MIFFFIISIKFFGPQRMANERVHNVHETFYHIVNTLFTELIIFHFCASLMTLSSIKNCRKFIFD